MSDSKNTSRKDFFVSYNVKDEKWAEWITWQLEENGFTTMMQRWDFGVGSNFVINMQEAVCYSDRIILVLTPSFLISDFTPSEWATFFSRDPTGEKKLVVPIKVAHCSPPGLLASVVYLDLVDKTEEQCKSLLVDWHPNRSTHLRRIGST